MVLRQRRQQLPRLSSDGFGREIQKKIQAEPEKVNGVAGPPRWVGGGWAIFNNKGKPIRQYEPFFSATHDYEFGVMVGVSPVLFYDPAERVIAQATAAVVVAGARRQQHDPHGVAYFSRSPFAENA